MHPSVRRAAHEPIHGNASPIGGIWSLGWCDLTRICTTHLSLECRAPANAGALGCELVSTPHSTLGSTPLGVGAIASCSRVLCFGCCAVNPTNAGRVPPSSADSLPTLRDGFSRDRMSDPLTVLSDTVAAADAAAKQCESTLSASWPDAAGVIHLRRLLAGTVLHVND